ncbi:MAG: hypothetical protein AB8G96_01200 [Phycisphaerales bacterium]
MPPSPPSPTPSDPSPGHLHGRPPSFASNPPTVSLNVLNADVAPDATAADPPPPNAPPYPPDGLPAAIDAAAALWIPLAARAWGEYRERGRGVLLLESDDLLAAAADDPTVAPPCTWVTATIIHRGDDFRGMLQRYDPRRQVMLIVAHRNGAEALFALECDGAQRPDPESCWTRAHGPAA